MISAARAKKNEDGFGKGKWSKTEHDRFIKGVQKYGKDWVIIQKVVKTRTLTQVRSHAQKVFQKLSESQRFELMGKENLEPDFKQAVQEKQTSIKHYVDQQPIQEVEETKSNGKKEVNLLNIFMKAFEQQSREVMENNQETPELEIKEAGQNLFQPQGQSIYHGSTQNDKLVEKDNKSDLNNCKKLEQRDQNSMSTFPISLDLSKK